MKTIRKRNSDNTFDYLRVNNNVAEQKVKNENWSYCSKMEWKKNCRDKNTK